MTKGQMEIMGLAIIVVLITLGVLFAITTMSREETSTAEEFEQQNLAAGFLNTLLGTNTGCVNATVRDLIRDCAQRGSLRCDPIYDPEQMDRSLDSCMFVNSTANVILNNTLGIRKSRYYLSAKGPYMEGIRVGSPCPGEQIYKSQAIPTKSGTTVTVEMRLCQ